jgi:hypothetical protein
MGSVAYLSQIRSLAGIPGHHLKGIRLSDRNRQDATAADAGPVVQGAKVAGADPHGRTEPGSHHDGAPGGHVCTPHGIAQHLKAVMHSHPEPPDIAF